MPGSDGEEAPSEVYVDPLRSMDSVDMDDDWVIVKKQRITILIPPPSPPAASRVDHTPKLSSGQTSLAKLSSGICGATRKKHPKQMDMKKYQVPHLESMEVAGNSYQAQEKASASTVHKDVPMIRGERSSHSPVAHVVKSDWNQCADPNVQGQFHQDTEKATSSFGSMYDPDLPVISSRVTNKIMRARLLKKRVAGYGGLRNWLLTCGFGWFAEILDNENLGMYQIVSLTMNQLKDMGLVAVGPRRKLIHAIDSLCGPNLFEMVS